MPKGIAQVIKYEGDNKTFIWKHPIEDFNTGTQLIVHESQEALLYINGQALDLFGPGRHTLETQNLPVLRKFFNRPTNDETPFHCEVYFINKVEQMAIKWGTESKIEYIDPFFNFPIKLGASGEMSLRVQDAKKLLVKVIGTERGIGQPELVQKFRMFLNVKLKPYLADRMKNNAINIFEVDEHIEDMSMDMFQKLVPDFLDYGLSLERFFITTIVKPEEDRSYQHFRDLYFRQYADVAEAKLRQQIGVIDEETKAKRMVIEAEALSQKRVTEGYTYHQERGFDVAEKVAQNEGVGEFANMGIGMGMVAGVGAPIGSAVGGIMQDTMGNTIANTVSTQQNSQANANSKSICSSCKNEIPFGSAFCNSCGTKVEEEQSEIIENNNTFCNQCGNKISAQDRFCRKCGNKCEV